MPKIKRISISNRIQINQHSNAVLFCIQINVQETGSIANNPCNVNQEIRELIQNCFVNQPRPTPITRNDKCDTPSRCKFFKMNTLYRKKKHFNNENNEQWIHIFWNLSEIIYQPSEITLFISIKANIFQISGEFVHFLYSLVQSSK